MLPPSFRETLLKTDYIDKRPTNTPGQGITETKKQSPNTGARANNTLHQ